MNIRSILDIMNALITEHEKLYEIMQLKQKAIISGKSDEIMKIVRDEFKCLQEIRKMEQVRQDKIKEFFSFQGKEHLSTSLLDMIPHVDKNIQRELSQCRTKLIHLIDRIRNVNVVTEKLTQQSIEMINQTVEYVMQPHHDDSVTHRMFDSRV